MTRSQAENSPSDEEHSGEEPSDGESPGPGRALVETTRCRNCENRHTGPYCNKCGQRQFGRLTVWYITRLFAERVFELERGLWPTFRDLTVDPGGLIQRYLRGKRRRYINPASYFILSAALLSFVMGFVPVSYRSLAGQLGPPLDALQGQYQILFFLFTVGIGAGLIRAIFPYRVNIAEATAACMYLMGHAFLALSLIRGLRRVLGDPAPVITSYVFIVVVLGWAGWAGYRAFERHWWPTVRMAVVPVAWFIAILPLLIQAQSYFSLSTGSPPFDTKRSREIEGSTIYTVPIGGATTIADFEATEPWKPPRRWAVWHSLNDSVGTFEVRKSGTNQYLHAATAEPGADTDSVSDKPPYRRRSFNRGGRLYAEHLREESPADSGLHTWNPRRTPYLAWKWRAMKTGSGRSMKPARPSSTNAGVNVGDGLVLEIEFGTTSLGRFASRSLRYVYSTTRNSDSLFVESNGRASFAIATFIVDSGGDSLVEDTTGARDHGKSSGDRWRTVRRNVASDYRRAFGERPPDSVDHVQVSIDFDPPYAKGTSDTVRVGVDDLRLYTSPPSD